MAVKLAYSIYGARTSAVCGPPLTVLHGLLGSQRNWKSLAKQLAEQLGRKVYVLDARNHGDSPHSDQMSTELMSEDVLEFWRAHSINKSVLLGHSMGGRTAMFTSLQHPELVDKLVVLDVAPTGTSGADTIRMVQVLKNVDLTSVKDKYEVDDIIKEHIPVSATLSVDTILSCLNAGVMPCQDTVVRQFLLTNIVHTDARQLEWKVSLNGIDKYLSEQTNPFQNLLKSFLGPTLFIAGSLSNYVTSWHVPEIKRLFPNAEITWIQNAGHWVHYEQPGIVTERLKKFLNEP